MNVRASSTLSLSAPARRLLAVVFTLLFLAGSFGQAAYASELRSGTSARPAGVLSAPSTAPAGTKWIDISLRSQLLVAYVGRTPVFSTRVSTGIARYPTVTGTFYIYTKLKYQRMVGGTGRDHYDLPNVPNVMYFFSGYAIHGAYWHHNFGHPMSHGCVNAPLSAAAWLFNWAPVGTRVVVHW